GVLFIPASRCARAAQLFPIYGEVPAAGRGWGGEGCFSSALLDVLARSAQKCAFEVVPHQSAACLQELVERLQQLALGSLGLAALGLNALAHVAVEEVDGLSRGPVD